jgi:hypothetical protein
MILDFGIPSICKIFKPFKKRKHSIIKTIAIKEIEVKNIKNNGVIFPYSTKKPPDWRFWGLR